MAGKLAVWSEIIKGVPSYRNCTYCALLMVLRYAGKDDFALDPEAEQQALRAADTSGRPETFTGASFAVKARYQIDVHLVPDQSRAGITAALRITGRAYAIAGRLSHFPAGHRLRRHAPTFTGFHALTVEPLGGDQLDWADPMNREGAAAERVTLAEVLQFIGTNYPQDARYLGENELGGDMTPIPAGSFTHVTKKTSLASAAPFRAAPSTSAAVHQTYPAGTAFPVDVIVSAEGSDWYGGWLYVNAGGFIYGYFGTGVLNPLADAVSPAAAPVPAPAPADCSDAVRKAVASRDAEWKTKLTTTLHP